MLKFSIVFSAIFVAGANLLVRQDFYKGNQANATRKVSGRIDNVFVHRFQMLVGKGKGIREKNEKDAG